MNIIICGAGKVGYSISQQLSAQGHSITVIDESSDEIKRIIDNMKPVIWVITDNGIGTLKSRNSFKEDFEEYFK